MDLWQQAIDFHQQKQWQLCLETLDKLIAKFPKHIEGLRLKGNTLAEIGETDRAIQAYQIALNLAPNCFEINYELGRLLWRIGKHQEALPLFQTATQINPLSYQAWSDLGTTYHVLGNGEEAIKCMEKSLEISPDRADTLASLAVIYAEQKNKEAAQKLFEKSIELDSSNAQVYSNYGAFLAQNKEPQKAIAQYEKAIELNPNLAHAYSNLGVLLREIGKLEEGIIQCRKAVELNPNLSEAYSNLALLLKDKGEIEEAIEMCHRSLEINPRNLNALNNLGNTLQDKQELGMAIEVYQKILEENPNNPKALGNLANALQKQDNLELAIEAYNKALEIQPNYALAYNNLGNAYLRKGDVELAIQSYQNAIDSDPEYAEARFHIGMAYLLTGDLIKGFEYYEYRWQMEEFTTKNGKPQFPQKQWKGEDLQNKTILLFNEQGLGDRIQFIRYASYIKSLGGTVLYECPKLFLRLFVTYKDIDILIPEGSPLPQFDYYIPLQSIPAIAKTNLDNIPNSIPYLFPPIDENQNLIDKIKSQTKLKVGLVWASSLTHKTSPKRSIPLILLQDLINIDSIQFFSLQKEMKEEEADLLKSLNIIDLKDELRDFADTATAINQLDLVISVDTAVAHLTGAMGKPLWLLLPFMPDWRWMLNRDDSPWYPTVKLFRQPKPQDWLTVLQNVRSSLLEFEPLQIKQSQENKRTDEQIRVITKQLDEKQKAFAVAQEAISAYEKGDFQSAFNLGSQVIEIEPNYVDVLNLMGVSSHKLGDSLAGVKYLKRALEINSEHKDIHANLGLILDRLNQPTDAIQHFKKAIELKPSPDLYNNLGNAYQKIGDFSLAIENYKLAIASNRNEAKYYYNLGNALKSIDRLDEAIENYTKAIEIKPTYARAYDALGLIYSNKNEHTQAIAQYQKAIEIEPSNSLYYLHLGNAYARKKDFDQAILALNKALELNENSVEALRSLAGICLEQKKTEESIKLLEKALTLTPHCPDTRVNLGVAYIQAEMYEKAKNILQEALEIRPDYAEVFINLGVVANKQEQYVEACYYFEKAIELKPTAISSYLNYGLALAMQERLEDAIKAFRSILQYEPEHPDAHMNIGIALMGLGNLKEGWKEYEWRHRVTEYNSRMWRIAKPLWDGRPFYDQTLLIYTEQGLGDCIQFARYIPTVKKLGGKIVVECNQVILKNIIQQIPEVDQVISIGEELPHFDFHYPLMSLPNLLGIDINQIPHNLPFINVSKDAVKLPIKDQNKLKVGIVWTANLGNPTTGKRRTIPLTLFSILLELEGIDFYILQKEVFPDDKQILEKFNDRVIDLSPLLLDLTDTASLVQQLDLVVTVDTMIAHLAGSFNVPTWIILPPAPDWRWLLKRTDSPWYRSVKLFRRLLSEDWEIVLFRVKQQLKTLQVHTSALKDRERLIRILAKNPNYGEAYNNLGVTELLLGNINSAVEALHRSVQLCPNLEEAKLNLATALLHQGNLKEGFRYYTYRWKVEEFCWRNQRPSYKQPKWNGKDDLSDKTIYIHPEQGFGDQIQFIRYLFLLKPLVGKIYYGCHQSLVSLFESFHPIDLLVVDGDRLPDFDYYLPLGDLPNLFSDIPFTSGYLSVNATDRFASFFDHRKKKIGIVWQTYSNHPTASDRSIGLAYLHQLFKHEECHFYVLQKEVDDFSKKILAMHPEQVTDLSGVIDNFLDTASIINCLDLVITIDSAVAHLAGALGKKTWLLLPYIADWRWQYNWYDSVFIFRQPSLGDWQTVIDRVYDSLDNLTPKSLTISMSIDELINLASQSYQNKDIESAINYLKQAVAIDPKRQDLVFNIGNILAQNNRLTEAISTFESIYESNSDFPEITTALSKAHYNLGNSYNNNQDFDTAIKCYLKSLEYNPNFFKAHTNLGIAYGKIGDLDKSIYHYQEAIKLHPSHADTYNNLANTLYQNDRYQEAISSYQEALKIDPSHAISHSGLASVYRDTGNITSALYHHSISIQADPTYANARFNLAQTLLLAGYLREGFREYEWRFKSQQFLDQGFVDPKFKQPVWDGSDLWGKRILILSEQGIGDQIQFIRYAEILKQKGAKKVFYNCPESLLRLFRSARGIDVLIAPGDNFPDFDCWVSLMSLPYLCETDLDTIPNTVPYLSVPFEDNFKLGYKELTIGICWSSRSGSLSAKRRSANLEDFVPIFTVPNTKFISLQKEITQAEKDTLNQWQIDDFSDRLTDFYDTACLIQGLDLVITVDTSVAHLVAALGKPTWILLNYSPDWRWLTDRFDSPWYPSVRLFRQTSFTENTWTEVINKIKDSLEIIIQPIQIDGEFNNALSAYRSGEIDRAISICKTLLSKQQCQGQANHLLGVIYVQRMQAKLAINHLFRALSYYPVEGGIFHALGGTLTYLRHLDHALYYCLRSLELEPNSIATCNNLGSIYSLLNNTNKSVEYYNLSLTIETNPDAKFGIALNLLRSGNYAQGWQEYEWRWQQPKFLQSNPIPTFNRPRWDGSSLQGKRILVLSEQGAGDQIQFWRFFDLLKARGAEKIIYTCVNSLSSLCRTLTSVDQVVGEGELIPDFDYWIPLLSLPLLLGITLENLPAPSSYLVAPSLPDSISPLFKTSNKKKIGVVWSCRQDHETTIDRLIPLPTLQPLLEQTDFDFFILQKEIIQQEEKWLSSFSHVLNLQSYLTDFSVTASVIQNLDLVITVDTSVAHLAGALGKPTWILLPFSCDWRWMNDRTDSPWYPSVVLWRQTKRGEWGHVIDRVVAELRQQNKPRKQKQKFAIGWSLGLNTGWGVFGTNFALQALKHPTVEPVLLSAQGLEQGHYNPLSQHLLAPLVTEWRKFQQVVSQHPHSVINLDIPVIHALGNNFSCGTREKIVGRRNIGFIFFENTLIHDEDKIRANTYDLILAGSTWNYNVLQENGIKHSAKVLQGVDLTLFHPAPKANLFPDRFVIFSGGKIEFRKGQDIVVAAFRRFYHLHPDALLVFAWHNFWSQFMLGMDQTGHVQGLPQLRQDKTLDIDSWLIANGLPPSSFVNLGLMPNYLMPLVYREADAALFPNRCEGGTNLVAMECLACGVPTILSANTGHLDLIDEKHCYPLVCQRPVPSHPIFPGTKGWGESDVDEIVEVLERIYHDRQSARQKGLLGAEFMIDLAWEKQIDRLVATIAHLL